MMNKGFIKINDSSFKKKKKLKKQSTQMALFCSEEIVGGIWRNANHVDADTSGFLSLYLSYSIPISPAIIKSFI